MSRYFELIDDSVNHYKFWEIIRDGMVVNVRYGRIGTTGQTQVKTFTSNYAAEKHVDKLIKEKTGKGYVEKPYKASGAAAVAPIVQKPLAVPKPAKQVQASLPMVTPSTRRRSISLPKEE